APATPGEPLAFGALIGANGPPLVTTTPPRGCRVEVLVNPSINMVEIIGLMSSPFMTVISGLPMSAQFSPRCWALHPAADEITVVTPPTFAMHLFCRPVLLEMTGAVNALLPNSSSSIATYVNWVLNVGLNVAYRFTPAKSPLA